MQYFLLSGKIQVLELTPQATGQMPEGTGVTWHCYTVCSSRTFLSSRGQNWGHMDTWPPPIFIPEGIVVQIHMIQLADFIPRDCSMKSLNDLPKDMHWVNSRNGNKTQSPDTGASSPCLDTSPNRENNLLKYQIALAFWWVSKPRSK